MRNLFRAHAKITSRFRTPSARRLRRLLNRKILDVALLRLRFRSIAPTKSDAHLDPKNLEVISARALSWICWMTIGCLSLMSFGCSDQSASTEPVDGSIGADTEADTNSEGDTEPEGDTDSFEECVAVNELAENVFQPLDIVFTIDNTPSMLDEINEVRENMNHFSNEIIQSGLDVRIILISCLPGECDNDKFHGICIDPPLGDEGGCPEDGPYSDTNLPTYLHVSERVPSVKGLERTIETYPQWAEMMRPGAVKHFVIVSDDTDETLPDAFIQGLQALDPLMFNDFQFNGIFSYMSKDAACAISQDEPCCEFAAPEGQAPDWTVYKTLVEMTDGVSGDLCLQDFDPVFEELAESVIDSAMLSCEWVIPDPPEGETLDPNLINMAFVAGDGTVHLLGRVDSVDSCENADNAWYYDDPNDPTMVYVCPQTCAWIQGDPNAEIMIQFGCETETIDPI
ncbi:MAG: hypothetical protein QNJ97_19010 [Myxococcota bacterium]|nr:hypothetical protein [Myxococcota bacterium]